MIYLFKIKLNAVFLSDNVHANTVMEEKKTLDSFAVWQTAGALHNFLNS